MDEVDIGEAIGIEFLEKREKYPTELIGDDRLGNPDPVKNLGTTFLLLTGVFVVLIIIVVVIICIARRTRLSDKNKERCDKLKGKIFYNALIRYTLLNALKLNLMAMLALNSNDEDADFMKKLGPILLLIILVQLPFIYVWCLGKRQSELDQPMVANSIGNLYQGLNLKQLEEKDEEKKSKCVWHYIFVFLVRRQLFIVLTVFVFDHPNMQMIGHIILTMINSTYLVADPAMFEEKNRKRIEVLNDLVLLLLSLFIQQNLRKPEPDAKEMLGDITLGVLGLLFIFNVTYIGIMIRDIIRASQRTKMIQKNKEAFEAAQAAKSIDKAVNAPAVSKAIVIKSADESVDKGSRR